MALYLSRIAVYPVKSLAAVFPQHAELVETGLRHDRNWLVVDADGVFLTQRQHPEMARVAVRATAGSLSMQIPGKDSVDIPVVDDGPERSVQVWDDCCEAIDQGDRAAELLSAYLGRPCRLVRMKPQFRRELRRHYSFSPEMHLSFADSAPLLLTCEASLEDLNGRLAGAVGMERFRPNLVVAGGSAFQEDRWKRIRIGEGYFRVARDCIRCEITTIDQTSGEKGIEPLETLERYRSGPKGARFGRKVVQENRATLRVSDEVEVLE